VSLGAFRGYYRRFYTATNASVGIKMRRIVGQQTFVMGRSRCEQRSEGFTGCFRWKASCVTDTWCSSRTLSGYVPNFRCSLPVVPKLQVLALLQHLR
jgi:hypothetical protein